MDKIMTSAEIQQALLALTANEGVTDRNKKWTQEKIGRAIDRSGSVISMYLQGAYSGDLKDLETRLRGFLEKLSAKEAVHGRQVPFVPIFNWNAFQDIARLCHLENELGVIVGEAGTSKTTSAKEYARLNPGQVIYIEADLSYSARVLFLLLCELLDLSTEGNINALVNRVIKRLKGSSRMIIIDQAEYLPFRALDLIRTVYDKAEVGVLLVGLPRLEHNLSKSKGSHAQLYSRVAAFYRLRAELSLQDAQAIVKSRLGGSVDPVPFHSACNGNTRALDKLIRRSKWIAENNKIDITEAVVRKAYGMLMG